MLKSEVADLKNAGDRAGGAISASLFLKEFVGETPWHGLGVRMTELHAQGKIPNLKEVTYNDSGLEALVHGTGFKGSLKCSEGKVVVALDLNFLLKPMRGQIEEMIQRALAKSLTLT